tara:strand:- start:59 stop:376 length:318 start_codon:yes stop_codon:yes gene_type:complete
MSKYIILGTFSDDGTKGIVAGDSDRAAAMEVLCNSVGAKLISVDITRGEYDVCVMVEAESFPQVAAMSLKARASGAADKFVTLEAVDIEEIRSVAKGVQYTPPSG